MQKFKWWLRLHGYWCTFTKFQSIHRHLRPRTGFGSCCTFGTDGRTWRFGLGRHTVSFADVSNVVTIQDKGELFSPSTPLWLSPDQDNIFTLVSSTPAEPTHSHPNPPTAHESFMSTAGNSKVKTGVTSRTPSSSQKSKVTMKRTFQDAFAEGSVKDAQMLEHLGTQKHERVIGEQELKCYKLEHKAMDKQHQREHEQCERECEQHKYHMMQMQLMMSQNSQGAPVVTWSQNQPSFEGFGLMAELGDAIVPSDSSYST